MQEEREGKCHPVKTQKTSCVPFVYVLLHLSSSNETPSPPIPPPCTAIADEGSVMLKLANSLGPLPTSWNKTSSNNFCISWHWLDCDSSGRVIDINLVDQHLTGTLPPELSNLTELNDRVDDDIRRNNTVQVLGFLVTNRPPLKLTIKPGKALLEMGMDTGVRKNPDTNATEETGAKKAGGVCLPVMLFLPFLL
ncbi:unnamed protein product [Dovyalis caffra]|uniref:Uncharacterized protein n=1 Tax=Dovyalis caffra TaxID=77055 RepID=A0AAV1S550_9ROSI|nr:unnamed protein product [Dovyalis caffra]